MPAVWRSFGQTLKTGVLAASICVAGAAYGDGWDPLEFQMIFHSSAVGGDPITYNPAQSGVVSGAMPFDLLGNLANGQAHPYANFFGEGATAANTPAWSPSSLEGYDYNFKGFKAGLAGNDDGFQIWWDVDIKVDPAVSVSLLMNNPTPVAQTFTLTIPLITGPIGPTSLMRGSASGTATDVNGNGGSLSALAAPGYQAWIDAPGNVVQTLIPTGFSQSIGNNATASVGPFGFGTFPAPAVPGPGVVNSIGLTLTFTLSGFDSAIVNAVFEVTPIPAPGAFAMLGVAGLLGARRRRRA